MIQDLQQVENELSELCSSSICNKNHSQESLVSKIISAMIQRKAQIRPWSSPLPPPWVSPPRTLGDPLASAKRINAASSPREAAVACHPMIVATSLTSSCASSDKRDAG